MIHRKNADCADFLLPSALAELPRESGVLLGLSGGVDSRVLLELLAQAARRDGFPLSLAHVNHGIRGEDAIRDREFCRALAERYGLPIHIADYDVPRLAAERGQGIEETAREVRYAFFASVMREEQIPLLATAHHADDNLETLLFRLSRGSRLRGLCGIAPCRRFGEGYLVRPLLRCTRREIEAYAEGHGLEFVSDVSNTNAAYARNRIRAQVVPVLESLFDAPQRRVSELCRELCEDEAFLQAEADRFLEKNSTAGGLSVCALSEFPLPILRRVLRRWVWQLAEIELERVHVEGLLELVRLSSEKNPHTEVALPCDLVAVCHFARLLILPRRATEAAPKPRRVAEGVSQFADGEIEVAILRDFDTRKIHKLYTQTCLISSTQFDIIKNSMYWRSYREGDLLLQGGMHKKLRKCWNEAGVPVALRTRLPILCDETGIVWTPFVGLRDGTSDASTPKIAICLRLLQPQIKK